MSQNLSVFYHMNNAIYAVVNGDKQEKENGVHVET